MFGNIYKVIILRNILHCDLNNFFASVEELNNPKLKNVPMAVCGDPGIRHGIILAKNNIAKRYGIYTPELVSSAKSKCPNLVLVEPHYEEYVKYSKLVNEIYLKYTDRVEPFSIDESFLDVTESIKLFGSAKEIAFKIKEEIKNTLGLTISVGVSFNKSLAKIGSDLKKPDAITELYEDNFKEKLYMLDVSTLLFAGKATCIKLNKLGIKTIGDLAYFDKKMLINKMGKIGGQLHDTACGIDFSEVKKYSDLYVPKSVSKGVTLINDTNNELELERVCEALCSKVVRSLRNKNLKASIVCVSLKDNMFVVTNKQRHINFTDSYQDILKVAKIILNEMLINKVMIRTITVSVSGLSASLEEQINMFNLEDKKIKTVKNVMDKLKDNNKDLQIGFFGK